MVAVCLSTMAGLAAAADVLWIDVRSAGEYSASHLPEAINIPYMEIATEIGLYTSSKR